MACRRVPVRLSCGTIRVTDSFTYCLFTKGETARSQPCTQCEGELCPTGASILSHLLFTRSHSRSSRNGMGTRSPTSGRQGHTGTWRLTFPLRCKKWRRLGPETQLASRSRSRLHQSSLRQDGRIARRRSSTRAARCGPLTDWRRRNLTSAVADQQGHGSSDPQRWRSLTPFSAGLPLRSLHPVLETVRLWSELLRTTCTELKLHERL
jgi:hypothetical protein